MFYLMYHVLLKTPIWLLKIMTFYEADIYV